ncbi:hypothetical protein ARMGADRAFT_979630 [Armillaria gallica]|uniref:WW domain-containing protein n=1 Tax=Armillaria gallica TaxID=47427 RepID=A0A2H3EDR4_ARMGA|nr:hypothetical protein ARMGADRAFT_979630 [Armillaria gallica]
MYLPQWLLKALRQVLCAHAGGRSPLKAILSLWRFFRRLFRRFSRTQDDGEPDKPPRHIANQGLYLTQSVEPTKCTMSLAADDNADEPVQAVVCRSTAPPYGPWSSHDMVPKSVASRFQTGLAFETESKPSNEHPPLHGSRPSSITSSSIGGSLYSSAHSNFSRLSQGISSTVHNSAADAHQNSLDVHLPHARPTSGQGGLSSDSEAIVVPPSPTAAQHDGQNQDGVPNSTLHDAYPYIRAVAPERLGAFFRNRPKKPHNPNSPPIPPLTTSFPLHGIPSGWSVHVHPQGLRYYVHERMFHASANTLSTSCVSLLRVFTDTDIVNPEEWRVLKQILENIINYMHSKEITLPPKVDLALGLTWYANGPPTCEYYFADHIHHSIFWLDDFDANEMQGVKWWNTSESSHLKHAIEAQYWLHFSNFPGGQELTTDAIEEVNDFLIHCNTGTGDNGDMQTNRYGFTLAEVQQMISSVTSIRNNPGPYSRPGSVRIIAGIMERRSRDRYGEFYGEPGAYLGPPAQVHREIYKRLRTPLFSLLSPLLFFAPDIHCIALHGLLFDRVNKADWSPFIRKLGIEWQEFVINATVLLNANIAFLAIQSIDDSSVDKGRSPAQIASYVSTIMSVGSIILGLLLLQKYRHKNRVYNTSRWDFLGIQGGDLGEKLGIETLAIMFSLPWALLMWAMIFFLAAFCLMCFTASSSSVRMIVGSALLVIGILIFWYLTISRERYELRWYVRAHVHLVNAWYRLSWELSTHLPAKFNMDWMKRMLWMSSNDVEMASMDSSTTASLDNDESTTCSHETTSVSSYETAPASSHATISSYDTASMRSHVTDVDVV